MDDNIRLLLVIGFTCLKVTVTVALAALFDHPFAGLFAVVNFLNEDFLCF
jgi:hypothetical protein